MEKLNASPGRLTSRASPSASLVALSSMAPGQSPGAEPKLRAGAEPCNKKQLDGCVAMACRGLLFNDPAPRRQGFTGRTAVLERRASARRASQRPPSHSAPTPVPCRPADTADRHAEDTLREPVLQELGPQQQQELSCATRSLRTHYLECKARLSVDMRSRDAPDLAAGFDRHALLARLLPKLPALRHLRIIATGRAELLDLLQQGRCSPRHDMHASFIQLSEREDGAWQVVATVNKVRRPAALTLLHLHAGCRPVAHQRLLWMLSVQGG